MTTATMTADARFLRRVMLTLIGLTLFAGTVAGFTTAQALQAATPACGANCP